LRHFKSLKKSVFLPAKNFALEAEIVEKQTKFEKDCFEATAFSPERAFGFISFGQENEKKFKMAEKGAKRVTREDGGRGGGRVQSFKRRKIKNGTLPSRLSPIFHFGE
jgi:hypothetical protein